MQAIDGIRDETSRPWLARYPHDLPPDVVFPLRHILDLYRASLNRAPDQEALRYFDGILTYRELDVLADATASWLEDSGVGAGDRVGVILQNVPHFIVAVLAIWKAGATPVPGNPMYKTDELSRIFADYGPAAIICHVEHRQAVARALPETDGRPVIIVTVRARDFQSTDDTRLLPLDVEQGTEDFLAICRQYSGRRPSSIALDESGTALILYTSGTTGAPKGAVISHASLAFNIQTSISWMRITASTRILALAPLFHITGFVLHMGVALATGCSAALHYRFQPEAVLDVIRAYRPTFTIAAITAFNALLHAPAASRDDFASFEHAFTGGAPVAPALREAVRAHLGIELWPVYGMTESCSPTHIAPPGIAVPVHPETGALSVGLPISSTDCRIVGPNGEVLPPGAAGEICVRGPQIMTGYLNKPEETAETLRDGWLRTGDVGLMDEAGWFYVIDRKKDLINASGFKVWPREVEDVLLQHASVREVAVVGVPDSYRGETVHAFVSLMPNVPFVDELSLIEYCRERLAAYKVPKRIWTLDELPKTTTGKIQRAALRQARSGG